MTSASPVSAPADTESRVVIRETRRSSAIGKVMVGLLGLVMTAGFVSYQPNLRIDPETAPALAALLATNIEVPSIAQTNRPCQRAAPTAGPRTKVNNSRSGATPTRRKACDSAEEPGAATEAGSRPAINRAQTCR